MAKEKSYLGEFTETLYRLERMAKDRDRWKDLAQAMGDELRNILRTFGCFSISLYSTSPVIGFLCPIAAFVICICFSLQYWTIVNEFNPILINLPNLYPSIIIYQVSAMERPYFNIFGYEYIK